MLLSPNIWTKMDGPTLSLLILINVIFAWLLNTNYVLVMVYLIRLLELPWEIIRTLKPIPKYMLEITSQNRTKIKAALISELASQL